MSDDGSDVRGRPPGVARDPRALRALHVARGVLLAVLALFVFGGIPGAPLAWAPLELTAPPLPLEITDREGRVTVAVRAANGGAPIAGARVQAYAIVSGVAYLAGSALTDAKGSGAMSGLPDGEHWIVADAPGYARGSSHLIVTPEARALDLELGEEHHLEVRVVDERGEPVARAELEVTGGDPLPVGARAGPDGSVIIGRLGKAPWALTTRATGYEEVTQRGVKEGDRVVVTLRKLGALVVRVVEGDAPASGARVQIAGPTLWPPRAADTGANGEVRIGALGAGSYTVRATRGERASPIELGVMLERGEEKVVTLTLGPGRIIVVRVMDGEGSEAFPIAGARVSLAEGGISPFPMEARTDKDGRARLGPIAPGSASIAARADGFVPRGAVPVPEKLDSIASAVREITIALARAGVLTGHVVDARGYPVDGATIEIIGTDFQGAPIADDPRRTSFREAHFEATLAGPTALVPAGELGVVPGPVPPIPHGFGAGGPSGTTGASALAPTGARAKDSASDEPWVTRADGTFRAAPASPGRIRALVRHPQFVEALSEVVTLTSGGEAHVEIVMHAGGQLEGRVVDSTDHAVAGARVQIAATRGSFERSTKTATDGTFAFASVPESLVVSAFVDDDATQPGARLLVTVPEGGRKSVTLTLPEPRGALPARVTDDRGYAIDAAQLSAHSLDPSAPLRVTSFTDARGEAQLLGAKGLSLRVEVSASGHAPKILTIDASAPSIAVSLTLAESATGEVRSSRGDALEGAEVVLYTELGARHTRTRADGTFALNELAAGTARLRVRAAGFAPVTKDVVIPASGGTRPFALARIELAGEGSVEGTVVDARGDPVQGARVAKDRVPTYLAVGATPPGVVVTDARGRFKLGELAEGDVTLEAYAPDVGRVRTHAIKVVAGRTTIDVKITLEKTDDSKSADPAASGGVAVTLGETSEPREVVVAAVAESSEAERAGLAPGDVLLEVDGARVHAIDEARAKLNGPLGDDVVVKLRRGERTETIRVARERVRR